ncbi:DUF2868 domain-containing protein [Marinobacter confluentis]|uniref:DUF2868 domain-containing protein n=1 Tax=Marinobacter confluentis TaxID=1697557 RepID=A0A4Z1BPK0_9GAMM|nr:DUF2868 domain-containing protein [Marinobacter confluentis]TGN39417.1 DUF2868 domain-containing protein [Marinobacter confluentis]
MADGRLRRLLAFDRQVRRDQAQSPVFLHRRDRRFALDCEVRNETPTVDRWLAHLQRFGSMPDSHRTRPETEVPEPSLTRWWQLMAAFAFAGIILGTVTMAGLLYYEGGQRINLTLLLAFAGLQTLLALVTIVQSTINWQPWRRLLRRVAQTGKDSPLKPLMPTLMARAAHAGGICFGLAGVATLLVLVVIQDLAFGWSTTLDTSAEGYHQLLAVLAWPWQSLWPAASPDLALVQATRFFRTETGATGADPELWGQWWPFVVMVWLFYVVVPRLLGLALAQIQLQRRARQALDSHSGMVALEYRLETPTVDTGNEHHDAEDSPDEKTAAQLQPLPDSQVLIFWAGSNHPELPDTLTAGHLLTEAAGGQHSLSEDEQTIQRCGDLLAKQDKPAVTLVTRAWEPPIAELQDFIELASSQWPKKTRIALLPYAMDAHQINGRHQLDQWLRFSERLQDKRIWVSQPDLSSPETRAYGQQAEGSG